jgi:alpha-beta hydrolase superfamily lysophospholipase
MAMNGLRTHLTGRRLRRSLSVLAVLLGLWLIASCVVAHVLTRRSRSPFAETPPIVSWGRIEPARLVTEDGLGIGAWFVAGPTDGPSVLLLHGNGGCRSASLDLAETVAREGCSVLAISLRAHGDSDGDRNDIGYGARRDVTAAVAYLERRRPGRPIVILATSLGAAAAIYAAGDLETRIRGYILEAPYRDIYSAVRNRTAAFLPRPLNLAAYGGLLAVSPLFLPEAGRMTPLERIADIPASTPILLLVGGRDDRARPSEVGQLHARVTSHARLLVFEGAGHEMLSTSEPARYRREIIRFIRRATGSGPDRDRSGTD